CLLQIFLRFTGKVYGQCVILRTVREKDFQLLQSRFGLYQGPDFLQYSSTECQYTCYQFRVGQPDAETHDSALTEAAQVYLVQVILFLRLADALQNVLAAFRCLTCMYLRLAPREIHFIPGKGSTSQHHRTAR